MAIEFRDAWLESFYRHDQRSRKIPRAITHALFRKLQIIDVAYHESDLRAPPGNRFEHLQGRLSGWCSIRVNQQYRLIFKWKQGLAQSTYLDPHVY